MSGQVNRMFDVASMDITFQTNFLFQLVIDPNADTDFTNLLTVGKSNTGWAIGSEHPVSATYGADDDIAIGNAYWSLGNDGGTNYGQIFSETTFLTNSVGDGYYETPFYFRWFNSPSAETATEAGIIYNTNWISNPEAAFSGFPLPDEIEAFLGYDEPKNLGSAKTNGIAGWQSMPRALLTAQGTPMRWFVDHGIELAPGNTWDDADTYDSDTNGVLNRAEYIAGTDPTDPESYLRIIELNVSPGTNTWTTELTWHGAKGGATNTLWHLYAATNGITTSDWSAVTGGTWSITGTGTNTWTQEAAPPATPYFLRIHAVAP